MTPWNICFYNSTSTSVVGGTEVSTNGWNPERASTSRPRRRSLA